jgi:hypothetical protein
MRILYTLSFLFFVHMSGLAQANDTIFPSATGPTDDPVAQSPFKNLSILKPHATGHKSSGTVDIAFSAINQSTQTATLIFSMNPGLSKASDDLDSLYSISQVRYGQTKQEPGDNSANVTYTVMLKPDQALHLGMYVNNVPLTALYIRKAVILTSLSLDDVPSGEDNIVLTNLKIDWK